MKQKQSRSRLDDRLLKDGLVAELREARALIMAGQVLVDEQRLDKPGQLVAAAAQVRIKDYKRFVSRGGEKLWGAVEDLQLAAIFRDAHVLDCGASTGGFTDCALQLGARQVLAVDIGFNQLAWSLRSDARVEMREQTDVRDLAGALNPAISLILADISFHPLERMLPALCAALPETPHELHFLLLVKPQFELENGEVPRGGVVEKPDSRRAALEKAQRAVESQGLSVRGTVDSRIRGREGNLEMFIYATRKGHEQS